MFTKEDRVGNYLFQSLKVKSNQHATPSIFKKSAVNNKIEGI